MRLFRRSRGCVCTTDPALAHVPSRASAASTADCFPIMVPTHALSVVALRLFICRQRERRGVVGLRGAVWGSPPSRCRRRARGHRRTHEPPAARCRRRDLRSATIGWLLAPSPARARASTRRHKRSRSRRRTSARRHRARGLPRGRGGRRDCELSDQSLAADRRAGAGLVDCGERNPGPGHELAINDCGRTTPPRRACRIRWRRARSPGRGVRAPAHPTPPSARRR